MTRFKWTGQLGGTKDWNCVGKTATLLLMLTMLLGLAIFSTCNVIGYPNDAIVKLSWPDSSSRTNTGTLLPTFHCGSWLSNQSSSQCFNGSKIYNLHWGGFTVTTKIVRLANSNEQLIRDSYHTAVDGSDVVSRLRTPFRYQNLHTL